MKYLLAAFACTSLGMALFFWANSMERFFLDAAGCDPFATTCQLQGQGHSFTIQAGPTELDAGGPIHFDLEGGGPLAKGEVNLVGRNMDMPPVSFELRPASSSRQKLFGRGFLSLCSEKLMKWRAKVSWTHPAGHFYTYFDFDVRNF